MAVELTEQEMALDRRAEEIRAELFESFPEFVEWLAEEFPYTTGAELIHELLVKDSPLGVGIKLNNKYYDYCEAKAYELARGEVV